jgi:hypothetical protein
VSWESVNCFAFLKCKLTVVIGACFIKKNQDCEDFLPLLGSKSANYQFNVTIYQFPSERSRLGLRPINPPFQKKATGEKTVASITKTVNNVAQKPPSSFFMRGSPRPLPPTPALSQSHETVAPRHIHIHQQSNISLNYGALAL